MSRYCYDVETDGLLKTASRMHILYLEDLDTGEMEYFLEGDLRWQQKLDNATLLVGHKIADFDNMILRKLFNYKIPKACSMVDTLILSRVLNYRRFGDQGHGLHLWGDYFGFPKGDHTDWTQYSEEMRVYCKRDVNLNVKVYNHLWQEFLEAYETEPMIADYIRAEHALATWCGLAELYGWPFDKPAAIELSAALEAEMQKAYDELVPQLGKKAVALDKDGGVVVPKRMQYTMKGLYYAHMADYFEVDPYEGMLEPEEREFNFVGEFCRVQFKDLSLDSHDDVKLFLLRNGWAPTEYNYKKDPKTKRKTKEKSSPKITEDSLDMLGPKGALYPEFLTAKSRFSILKTWIEETDSDGMLHGDCITIGTPSMRATHKTIVNVPSSDSPWGREMRSLFKSLPGWTLIGCDSSGNQARGLAYFLGDEEFIDVLVNGDVHAFNAKLLDESLARMGHDWTEYVVRNNKFQLKGKLQRWLDNHGFTKRQYVESRLKANRQGARIWAEKSVFAVKRAAAKRILYAFLFGAAGPKLWSYIYGTTDVENGRELKSKFTQAVPGFEELLERLSKIYKKTSKVGDGYIPGIAGNRIYVDSTHKLLVYLLQSTEKATCSAALMLTMERLDEKGIPFRPCIMMHDEIDFLVPDEHAEAAMAIGKKAFEDGPKLFGINFMSGSGKSGQTWYDVH
jgi:hypothetical protein